MKKSLLLLTFAIASLATLAAHAQPGPRGRGLGGPPAGPQFGGDLGKFLANTRRSRPTWNST